jgi:hypothetical protein
MKTHTPEPWRIRTDLPQPVIASESGQYVVAIPSEVNASRIVECVNAMEGIQNPAEFIASIYDVLKECKHQLQLQEPFRLEDTIAKIDKILKE